MVWPTPTSRRSWRSRWRVPPPACSPTATGPSRPVAVVGRDPRASGEMLEAAVVAGLTSAGAEVLRAGVLPTPALAYLDRSDRRRPRRHDLGQPQPDARQRHQAVQPRRAQAARRRRGRDRAAHRRRRLRRPPADRRRASAASATCPAPPSDYPRTCFGTVDQPLDGLARGRRLRARRRLPRSPPRPTAGPGPGARHRRRARRLEHQRRRRLHPPRAADRGRRGAHGADLGIAHDGDADRCLAVDRRRRASSTATPSWPSARSALHERGAAHDDTVVATVMSNLGFHHAMRDAGIAVQHHRRRRPLRARGAARRRPDAWAASRAGHLVFLDHATTGDGLLTGLPLLSRMARHRLARWPSSPPSCRRLPQVLVNVPVARPARRRRRATRSPRRSTPSRRSSATPAGCCCGRRAPSSSSG